MSDEIPVGSPPAPPGRHAAPGGWYADPVDQVRERYWDGWQWTRNVRPRERGRGRYAGSPPPPHRDSRGEPTNEQIQGGQVTGGLDQDPGTVRHVPEPVVPTPYAPPGIGPYGQSWGPLAYRMVPATADGVPLAGWGWRALAFLVDYFLLYAVTRLIAAVTPLGAGISRAGNAYQAYITEVLTTGEQMDFAYAIGLLNTPELVILNIVSMVLFVVYSGLMLRSRGATLGKLLFRMRVVPIDRGRSGPGLTSRTAWLRPIATQLFSIVWLVSLVDYLFPLWDRRRQTLHDKVAATQVVREARR